MDSPDFYSEVPGGYRDESDEEALVFDTSTDLAGVRQLVVTNIFPKAMPGITMHMISLRNNCSVKAEPESDDKAELVEEISQIDPFITRMFETGESSVIGNKHTGSCVRISMIKPSEINSFRNGVLMTLARKRTTGRDNLSSK